MEYDLLVNSNSSFHAGADILHLFFLYEFLIFFHVQCILRFYKTTYWSLLFKMIFSVRLSNSLWGLDVFRIQKCSIHLFIILLLNSLNCYIHFSNFLCSIQQILFVLFHLVNFQMCHLPLLGNLWNIYLGVNVLSPSPFISFIGNIPLLKVLRVNSQPS